MVKYYGEWSISLELGYILQNILLFVLVGIIMDFITEYRELERNL